MAAQIETGTVAALLPLVSRFRVCFDAATQNFATLSISALAPLLTVAPLLTATAGCADPQLTSSTASDLTQLDQSAVFLWQGMEHSWERRVGGFLVPHRISRLGSYLHEESHELGLDGWLASTHATFAQSTGVDGNFMKPKAWVSALKSPNLKVLRGRTSLTMVDRVGDADAEFPFAEHTAAGLITVDLRTLSPSEQDNFEVVLQGFDLRSVCVEPAINQKACNSDGFWPYFLDLSIGNCARNSPESLTCPITFKVKRAWTPYEARTSKKERGKGLNVSLSYAVDVHYAVLGGEPSKVAFNLSDDLTSLTNRLKSKEPVEHRILVPAPPGFGRASSNPETSSNAEAGNTVASATGFKRLGFDLKRGHVRGADHFGRYIGSLKYRVQDLGFDTASQSATILRQAQVWAPDTVFDAPVHYHLQTLTTFVRNGERRVGTASGTLCIPSSEAAPPWSRWNRCEDSDSRDSDSRDHDGKEKYGPERTSDTVQLALP